MNSSGDAAEQIVRFSLEGVEIVAKITGSAAKEIAALLYTLYKNRDVKKVSGSQSRNAMLRSGKATDVFRVQQEDLKRFTEKARQYGVVYSVIRKTKNNPLGICEIIVRAEDGPKINRIVEGLKMSAVKVASIETEEEKGKEKTVMSDEKPEPGKDVPEKSEEDKLLDELLEKPLQKESVSPENPTAAKTDPASPSEHSYETSRISTEGARPSVREDLREIRAGLEKEEAKAPAREAVEKTKSPTPGQGAKHQQPNGRKKNRSHNKKER